MTKLEEGSNKWPKASLEVLHRSWCEHGASVRAQMEVQAMLGISQVLYVQIQYTEAVFPIIKYFYSDPNKELVYFQVNVAFDILLRLCSWWTCSGSSAWQ